MTLYYVGQAYSLVLSVELLRFPAGVGSTAGSRLLLSASASFEAIQYGHLISSESDSSPASKYDKCRRCLERYDSISEHA
jgi:hypothetical protein